MVLTFPDPPAGIQDTTSRSICKTFQHYIYLYEVMAQLTRLVYCDSGIIKKVFDTDFGRDNFSLMGTIGELDKEFQSKKRSPLESQKASEIAPGIPHESYALGSAPIPTKKYATYIATRKVLTAIVLDTSVADGILLKKGPFEKTDIIISFKGTSTFQEAIHDLKSVFMRVDLNDVIRLLGLPVIEEDAKSFINGSFTNVLLDAWNVIIKAISEHGEGEFRLFCTGHSLGGAYCTLLGFLLGYIKQLPNTNSDSDTIKLVKRIKSIHIISLGAPTICADKARNVFNRFLIDKSITFDRLVTQKFPTLTASTAFTDIIPLIPYGFSHPGFKQSNFTLKQDNNRPYILSSIYILYNKGRPKNYRMQPVDKKIMEELKKVEKTGEKAVNAGAAKPAAAEVATEDILAKGLDAEGEGEGEGEGEEPGAVATGAEAEAEATGAEAEADILAKGEEEGAVEEATVATADILAKGEEEGAVEVEEGEEPIAKEAEEAKEAEGEKEAEEAKEAEGEKEEEEEPGQTEAEENNPTNLSGGNRTRKFRRRTIRTRKTRKIIKARRRTRNNKKIINARRKTRKNQRGGFFGLFDKEKRAYEKLAEKQSSNFISVPAQGLGGILIPHIVYFGMRYMTSLRLLGMKNPVPPAINKCAYFGLYPVSDTDKEMIRKKLTLETDIKTRKITDENIKKIQEHIQEGVLINYIDCPGYSFKKGIAAVSLFPGSSKRPLNFASLGANSDNTLIGANNTNKKNKTSKINKTNRGTLYGLYLGGSQRVTAKK